MIMDVHVLHSMYSTGVQAPGSAFFGAGTGPIQLDDVACLGSENRLDDCPNSGVGVNNCGHTEDASVICTGTLLL